jgi:SAM-dependent methyltransferase
MSEQKHDPQAQTPERVLQITSGAWATGILGAAVTNKVLTHLSKGPATPDELAARAFLAPRGAHAILDGLHAIGLVTLAGGKYANAPDADAFLVEGRPAYLGAYVEFMCRENARWEHLPEAVKTGEPQLPQTADVPENPFWEGLVPAIAVLAAPIAETVVKRLGLAEAGPVTTLDIGGGSGIYSAIFLRANPAARARQLDWANVNRIAKDFVARFGVADRFETLDGDFHTADLGAGVYDVVVYSNIAHQETPESNVEVFTRVKRALKPGGTLVVSDFVVEDDRSGPTFPLLFASMMLLATHAGRTYAKSEYRAWLEKAGFTLAEAEPTGGPSTLIYAR